MGVVAKKWVKVRNLDGAPKPEDFRLEEETLAEIKDGEFVCEAVVLSVDPYMRIFANTLPDGVPFMGEQVAKVTESKNAEYPVGSYVCILAGWRTHTISDGKTPETRPLPDMQGLPSSLALGAVGMPGGTAYFGLHEVGALKEGDVVFVNGAAGAVGSIVGQMAKLKGCTVIGTAGSEDKIEWLTKDLGFDHVINYKTCGNFDDALKTAAPNGVDLFYDNVGSGMSERVMAQMNACGRVVICGTMAGYNDKNGPGTENTGILPYHHILLKTLTVRGFTMWQYMDRRGEAEKYIAGLIKEGKLKYKEHSVSGFENMPSAFMEMLKGQKLGKTVITI